MVDIDVDLQKLCQYLQEQTPDNLVMEEGLKTFIRFFDRLVVAFEVASPEMKKELGKRLSEMAQKIAASTKQLIEGTGLKEEELTNLTSKPEGWNEDLWRLIQESRKQIADSAKKLGTLMLTIPSENSPQPTASSKPDKKRPPQPPKSQWMKS